MPRVRRYRDGLYPVKEMNENAQRFMLRLITAPYKYRHGGEFKRDLTNSVSKNYAMTQVGTYILYFLKMISRKLNDIIPCHFSTFIKG